MTKNKNLKHEPLRMCIVCREMKPQKSMVRIVKNECGIVVDLNGKQNGRGCYICLDDQCISKIKKQKVLNRVYKTNVAEDVYDNICGVVIGKATENKNQ